AEEVEALRREDADDLERQVSNPKHLPDGIHARVQLVGDGLADDAHFGGGAHVGVGEHRSFRYRPQPDVEVGDVFAENLRVPVQAVGEDLGAVAHFGTDRGDAADLVLDRERVLHRERAGGAPAAADAARGEIAGENRDDVLAEAGDGRLDLR